MSENKETKETKITYESIWEDLSKVDCSEHIKEIKYGNRHKRGWIYRISLMGLSKL